MKIERDKLYRVRNGRTYKVIYTERPGSHPIVGFDAKSYVIVSWYEGGRFFNDRESAIDIIAEVREPREWLLKLDSGFNVVASILDIGPHIIGPSLQAGETVRVREVLDETT